MTVLSRMRYRYGGTILTALAALALCITAAATVVHDREQQVVLEQFRQDVGQQADLLAHVLAVALPTSGNAEAHALLQGWARHNPEIVAMRVSNPEGEWLFDYERSEPAPESVTLARRIGGTEVDGAELVVRFDLLRPREAIQKLFGPVLAGSAVLLLLLAAVLCLVMWFMALRPLEAEVRRRVGVESDLRRHQNELDALVQERTRALAEANAELQQEVLDRHRAEEELHQLHNRHRLLLESAGEGIYGVDTDGRCTFVNDAAVRMFGRRREELLGKPIHDLVHHSRADGTPYPADECPMQRAFRHGVPLCDTDETLWHKDGRGFTVEYSSYPMREDGRIVGAVTIFRDVTETRALARQLAYHATHDALTGLVNRREFERRLERVVASSRERASRHALLFLDLDHFKNVNDSAGHAAGDELLVQLASVMSRHVRVRDTVARMGGDEFAVLLEHCPVDQAMRVARNLRDAVRDFELAWEERSFAVGVSIGVTPIQGPDAEVQAVLRAADGACYAAKSGGRNRVELSPGEPLRAAAAVAV